MGQGQKFPRLVQGGRGRSPEHVRPMDAGDAGASAPLMPHSDEAERAVLGALLLDGEAWGEVKALLVVEDFYRESSRHIWRAIEAVTARKQALDVVTLIHALRDLDLLERVGGVAYIAQLSNDVATAANVAHYAGIVKRKSVLRAVIERSRDLSEQAHTGEMDDLDGFLDRASFDLAALGTSAKAAGVEVAQVLKEYRAHLKAVHNGFSKKKLLPTGLAALDAMLGGGLRSGEYTIVQGLTSHGKSVMAMHLLCASQERPVEGGPQAQGGSQSAAGAQGGEQGEGLPGWAALYFSTEIPREDVVANLMGYAGGYWPNHFINDLEAGMGLASPLAPRVADASDKLRGFDLCIYDNTHGLTSEFIVARALRRADEEDRAALSQGRAPRPVLVVVDYLQLIKDEQRKGEIPAMALMRASSNLRDLAKRHDGRFAVVVMAQSHGQVGKERRAPEAEDVYMVPGCRADVDTMLGVWRPCKVDSTRDREEFVVMANKCRKADVPSCTLRFVASKGGRLEDVGERTFYTPTDPAPPRKKKGGGGW